MRCCAVEWFERFQFGGFRLRSLISTMKIFAKLGVMVCLLTTLGFGQAVRFGDGQPVNSVQTVAGVGVGIYVATPNATINSCTAPANAVPCTNKATTYTDSTGVTGCATSTQVVLSGTSSCVGSSDARGNWGVWILPGQYAYTVTVSGASSGPFFVTAGGTNTSSG